MAQNPVTDDFNRIFSMMQGFMGSAAIRAGLDLEIFTHIAKGSTSANQLAATKRTSVRAMRILCDALVAYGVLNKRDGHYSLPQAVETLLVKGSPLYAGGFSRVVMNPLMWEQAGRLADVVRAGHSLLEQGAEAEDHPFWHEFQRGSRQVAAMTAPTVAEIAAALFPPAGPRRVLDIACGSGMYGFSVLQRFPNARLVSVDWPGVLKLTEPIAKQLGLEDRVEFRPADIFKDELGSGYDLVLAVNIYHHFSIQKNLELSRRLYAALAPRSPLIIVDMIPDPNREKNNFALTFALAMLIWTQEGDTYTLDEYQEILAPAGFQDIMLKEVPGPRLLQAIVAYKQPLRT